MHDPELKALNEITRAIAELDEEQRRNVLLYVNTRYGRQSPPALRGGGRNVVPAVDAESVSDDYEGIGDFFDAADPETEAERVLVVAYWVQVVEGVEDLGAMQVSKQLKDLGHSVSNITRAFDSMMSQRPRLVIQVRKSGKAKQARKRYRVSREGIKRVQSMLAEIKGADDGE